jgi:catechol 2,3-dioxygenase
MIPTEPLSAVRAGAYLHHLQLQSENPARLADFYAAALDMRVEPLADGSLLCRGPGRRVLFAKGGPKSLGFAAFACRDRQGLEELRERARVEGLGSATSPSPLFDERAFSVRDPDGNAIVFGLAPQPAEDEGATSRLHGPLQHLTLATRDPEALENFYAGKLGFAVSDRVRNEKGEVNTCWTRSNHEHHTLAFFRSRHPGIDHHSYEAGEWTRIRDWADHFGRQNIKLIWGPGRHGPGNHQFIFIADTDGNWIEVSAELEVIHDRPPTDWPHEERTLNLWGQAIMRS